MWFKSFSVSYHQLLNSNLRSLSQRQTCFHTQCCWAYRGNRGLIVRESDCNPKVAEFESQVQQELLVGGVNVQHSFHPQYHWPEVPFSKSPNPQLLSWEPQHKCYPLLRVCVHGVCLFTAVCVHLGWVKFRAPIPSMGHHTWPHVTFTYECNSLSEVFRW